MDGLVIKVIDTNEQIALKFEPKGEITTVTKFGWEIGTTGKLVPKIFFNVVNVGGSNLSQAAIGSYQGYLDLDAPIGSKVLVKKMGDVIPKVTKVVERSNENLDLPTTCPRCNSVLIHKGADLYCENALCPVKIKLKCSAVFNSLGIKGVTPEWINKLVDMKKIEYNYQVVQCTWEDIMSTGGYSENRAKWVIEEMKNKFQEILSGSKVVNLLWMLPIPTVSNTAYEKMAKEFPLIEELYRYICAGNIEKDYWIGILGKSKGTKVTEYLIENLEQIKLLIENLCKVVKET
jgi:DNA ligase (NAD+)